MEEQEKKDANDMGDLGTSVLFQTMPPSPPQHLLLFPYSYERHRSYMLRIALTLSRSPRPAPPRLGVQRFFVFPRSCKFSFSFVFCYVPHEWLLRLCHNFVNKVTNASKRHEISHFLYAFPHVNTYFRLLGITTIITIIVKVS